jgi:translation initiation factor 3 subunit E
VDFEFETLKLATLMAEYDITQKLIPFIDRHLAFPILSHLSEISLFPEEDVRFAQYELARGTNMVDFTLDLFQQLYPDQDPPPGKYPCPFL